MKRIGFSICAAMTVCLVAWCGGFDFNERGVGAAMIAIYAIAAGLVAYAYADPGT